MSDLEKSRDMEVRYASKGEDAWGNRERQLYQKILKRAVNLCYENLVDPVGEINIYDIGAGGGNVLDTWIANKPVNRPLNISGCDISETAIKFLEERFPNSCFDNVDLEEYNYSPDTCLSNLRSADIVSIVDVMYYFGEKRDYKETLDEIWDSIKPGAIVLVADNLVRAFRRDYFSKKHDSVLLESYTDNTEKVCQEVSESGKVWHRYLKVRIYKKF